MSYRKLLSIIGDLESEVKQVRNKLAFRIDSRVCLETPVDTGEARINWLVTDGRPTSEHIQTELNASGAAAVAIQKGSEQIQSAKVFTELYIQNNAPHIERLNEGWSEQAPSKYIDTIISQEVARG